MHRGVVGGGSRYSITTSPSCTSLSLSRSLAQGGAVRESPSPLLLSIAVHQKAVEKLFFRLSLL